MGHTSRQARRNTMPGPVGNEPNGRTIRRRTARNMGTRPGGRWGAIPYILVVWCVSRVILIGIGMGARSWVGYGPGSKIVQDKIGTGFAWLDIWSAWDSYWYYSIADVGYLASPVVVDGYNAWAFFPLYPWVARAVAAVVGNLYIAALLVSNISLLIGAWALYNLVQHLHDDAMARKAVLFLFLFPAGYALSCLLTEGLFFVLTVGAWYCARQHHWLLAGLLGMASAMTRLVGLFMAPLLALEYLRQRQWHIIRIRPDALWIGLVPIGLVVFMAVCYTLTGNPLQFVEAQDVWGVRENPLWTLWSSLERAWHERFSRWDGVLGNGYGALAAIVAAGVLLWGRKQIGTLLCFWSLAQILISLAANIRAIQSMPRHLAVIFPLFMILASLRTKSVAFVITVVVLSLLQAATFALWTMGWVVAV